MKHRATGRFWEFYSALPKSVRQLADRSFLLLTNDIGHPSLRFKKIGKFWSARVGRTHRALAVSDGDDVVWVWIGTHDEYDRMISNN